MTEAEIAAAMKEWGPLVDLPMAAYLAKVSEQRMRALWHASTFRKFLVLGRYMVRLAEVELWLAQRHREGGRPAMSEDDWRDKVPPKSVVQRATVSREGSVAKPNRPPRPVPHQRQGDSGD